MAASPLPFWGPKRGQNGYVTPAVSRVPKTGLNKGPHRAGRKKLLRAVLDKKKIWVPKDHPNQKWPTSGPNGYISPAVWGGGSLMLQSGGQDKEWPTSGPSSKA